MLLAAKALNDEVKGAKLSIDGAPVSGPIVRSLTADQLKDHPIEIFNNGDTSVDAVVSVIGAALTPEPAVSKGFQIERKAYTLDGKPVDMASLTGGKTDVKQNDRFVMMLTVSAQETGGRVMVVDRLPAGFEIENPRLVESGSIKGLDFIKSATTPEHTEFRDDRFVAAFNFSNVSSSQSNDEGDEQSTTEQNATPAATATLAYIVRAVTPGTFVHPAATVEDMYRPERYARTEAGTLSVGTKE